VPPAIPCNLKFAGSRKQTEMQPDYGTREGSLFCQIEGSF